MGSSRDVLEWEISEMQEKNEDLKIKIKNLQIDIYYKTGINKDIKTEIIQKLEDIKKELKK